MPVSAIYVELADGRRWFHRSGPTEDGNFKFRQLVNGIWEEVNLCDPDILDERNLADLRKIAGRDSIPLGAIQTWERIFISLEDEEHTNFEGNDAKSPVDASAEKLNSDPIVVPRTRLKRFRFVYRDLDTEMKRALAEFFCGDINQLSRLWNDALRSMQNYNCMDPFVGPNRKELPDCPESLMKICNTTTAQSYFKKSQKLPRNFSYVDREIAPLTTRGGRTRNGQPATSTSRGGMDLLLKSPSGQVCVGEVKVGADSELFEALLQGLWYASEVASESQMRRLAEHFPNSFSAPSTDWKVDIVVFSINQDREDETTGPALALANQIEEKPDLYPRLGKVMVFKNDGETWLDLRDGAA